MKKSAAFSPLFRIGAGVVLALTCFHPVVAAEPPKDISQELRGMHNIVSAEVYTIASSLSFRHTLHEIDAVAMGCQYRTVDMKDVDGFLALLANARIVERPADNWSRDVRTVIYLYTQEGQRISLVMTIEFSTAPSSGFYNGTLPVITKMGFGTDLLNWKRQHKPLRGDPMVCKDD